MIPDDFLPDLDSFAFLRTASDPAASEFALSSEFAEKKTGHPIKMPTRLLSRYRFRNPLCVRYAVVASCSHRCELFPFLEPFLMTRLKP